MKEGSLLNCHIKTFCLFSLSLSHLTLTLRFPWFSMFLRELAVLQIFPCTNFFFFNGWLGTCAHFWEASVCTLFADSLSLSVFLWIITRPPKRGTSCSDSPAPGCESPGYTALSQGLGLVLWDLSLLLDKVNFVIRAAGRVPSWTCKHLSLLVQRGKAFILRILISYRLHFILASR